MEGDSVLRARAFSYGSRTTNGVSVTFFGIWSPFIFFPIFLIGTPEAKSAYCLFTVVALMVTEALPPPVVALVPFLIFVNSEMDSDPVHINVPTAQLLHEVGLILMVSRVESTSLLDRTSLHAVALLGTRLRSLLWSCMLAASLCCLVMSHTAAVLLVGSVAENLVQVLQNNVVQARETATSVLKWDSLEKSRLFLGREVVPRMANPKYANSWVLNCLMDVNATDTQLMQHEPAKSALSVPGIVRKGRKQTSIMEDGHVQVPGKDSAHHKSLECINLSTGSAQPYTLLHRCRRYSRFQQVVLTRRIWWLLLVPANLLGIAMFWCLMKFLFLNTLYAESVPALLFLVWVVANYSNVCESHEDTGSLEYQEPLALDYLLVLLVFVIPWQLLLDGKLLDFRKVAKQLPWGALIVVFSSHLMGIIAKESGLAVWISNRIGSGHLNSVPLSQVILAVCSALMTELMTDVATASILLPVALDVAISIQCHPLLLVLPMSVAASTSLIFPTGSMALALLHSVTGLAPLEM
ncbi:hypothetical protein HPB47_002288, partial [Ixodes persulcatus]